MGMVASPPACGPDLRKCEALNNGLAVLEGLAGLVARSIFCLFYLFLALLIKSKGDERVSRREIPKNCVSLLRYSLNFTLKLASALDEPVDHLVVVVLVGAETAVDVRHYALQLLHPPLDGRSFLVKVRLRVVAFVATFKLCKEIALELVNVFVDMPERILDFIELASYVVHVAVGGVAVVDYLSTKFCELAATSRRRVVFNLRSARGISCRARRPVSEGP